MPVITGGVCSLVDLYDGEAAAHLQTIYCIFDIIKAVPLWVGGKPICDNPSAVVSQVPRWLPCGAGSFLVRRPLHFVEAQLWRTSDVQDAVHIETARVQYIPAEITCAFML